MSRLYYLFLLITFIPISGLAQLEDKPKFYDLKLNLSAAANFHRPAFEIEVEYAIGKKTSWNTQLGYISNPYGEQIYYQRTNFKGVIARQQYRHYLTSKYFQHLYAGIDLAYRYMTYDAFLVLGIGVTDYDDYYNASYYKGMDVHYKSQAVMLHAMYGYKTNIFRHVFLDFNAGIGPRWIQVKHDIDLKESYAIPTFYNVLAGPAYETSKIVIGAILNVSLGFRL